MGKADYKKYRGSERGRKSRKKDERVIGRRRRGLARSYATRMLEQELRK